MGEGAPGPRGKRSALCLFERGVEAFEAGCGPELFRVVVIAERRRSLRQLEPLRFPPGVDVYVRLQSAGLVERADAYEPEIRPAPVVAPERRLTPRAAVDIVWSVLARHRHGYRFAAEQLDRLSLDNRVQYECAPRQALAVVAMTAVDEHWLVEELEANGSAGATAGDLLCHGELIAQLVPESQITNHDLGITHESRSEVPSSVGRRIPTFGDASRAIRARLPGPSRPNDARCRGS